MNTGKWTKSKKMIFTIGMAVMLTGCAGLHHTPDPLFFTVFNAEYKGALVKSEMRYKSASYPRAIIAGKSEAGEGEWIEGAEKDLRNHMENHSQKVEAAITQLIGDSKLCRFMDHNTLIKPEINYFWHPKKYLKQYISQNGLDFALLLTTHFGVKGSSLLVESTWQVMGRDGNKKFTFETSAAKEIHLSKFLHGLFDSREEKYSDDYHALALENTRKFLAEFTRARPTLK